jgi:hypothetical protein
MRLIASLYREFQKLTFQRINNPLDIRANELNRQFSKEEYKWPIIYEEMLNILGHKRNANQNDIVIPPHPSQNGYHQ